MRSFVPSKVVTFFGTLLCICTLLFASTSYVQAEVTHDDLILLDDLTPPQENTMNAGTLRPVESDDATRYTSDVGTYVITIPNFPNTISANYNFIIESNGYFTFLEDSTCSFLTVDYTTSLSIGPPLLFDKLFDKTYSGNNTRYILSPPSFISRDIRLYRPGATDTSGRITCNMRTARYAGDFSTDFMKVTLSQRQLVTNALLTFESTIDCGTVLPLVLVSGEAVSTTNSQVIPSIAYNLEDISVDDVRATMSAVFPMGYNFHNELIPHGDAINVIMPISAFDQTGTSEVSVFIDGIEVPSSKYSVKTKFIYFSPTTHTFVENDSFMRLASVVLTIQEDISYNSIASNNGSFQVNGIVYVSVRVTNTRPLVESFPRTYNFAQGDLFVASISSFLSDDLESHYMVARSHAVTFPSIPMPRLTISITAPEAVAGVSSEYTFMMTVPDARNNAETNNRKIFDMNLFGYLSLYPFPSTRTKQDDDLRRYELQDQLNCRLFPRLNAEAIPSSSVTMLRMPLDPNDELVFNIVFENAELFKNVAFAIKCNLTPRAGIVHVGSVAVPRSFINFRGYSFYMPETSWGATNLLLPAVSASTTQFAAIRATAINIRNPTSSADLMKIYIAPVPLSESTSLLEIDNVFSILHSDSKCSVLVTVDVDETTSTSDIKDDGYTVTIQPPTIAQPNFRGLRIAGIFSRNHLVIACTNLKNDVEDAFQVHGPYTMRLWSPYTSVDLPPTATSRSLTLTWGERAASWGSSTAGLAVNTYPNLIHGDVPLSSLASSARFLGSRTSPEIGNQDATSAGVGYASLDLTIRDIPFSNFRMVASRVALTLSASFSDANFYVSGTVRKNARIEIYATTQTSFPLPEQLIGENAFRNLYYSEGEFELTQSLGAFVSIRLPLIDLATPSLFPANHMTTGLGSLNLHVRIQDLFRTDMAEIKNVFFIAGLSPWVAPTADQSNSLSRFGVNGRLNMLPFRIAPTNSNPNDATAVISIATIGDVQNAANGKSEFSSITLSFVPHIYQAAAIGPGVAPDDLGMSQAFRVLGDRIHFTLPLSLSYIPDRSVCIHAGRILRMEVNDATDEMGQTLSAVFNYDYTTSISTRRLHIMCSNMKAQGVKTTVREKSLVTLMSSTGRSRFSADISSESIIRGPTELGHPGTLAMSLSSLSAGGETNLFLVFTARVQIPTLSYFRFSFNEDASMIFNYRGATRCGITTGNGSYVYGTILSTFLFQEASFIFQMNKSSPAIPVGAEVKITCTRLRNNRNMIVFNDPSTSRALVLQTFATLEELSSLSAIQLPSASFMMPELKVAPFGGSGAAFYPFRSVSQENIGAFSMLLSPINVPNVRWDEEQSFTVYLPEGWSLESLDTTSCTLSIYPLLELVAENIETQPGGYTPPGSFATIDLNISIPATNPHGNIRIDGETISVSSFESFFSLTTIAMSEEEMELIESKISTTNDLIITCKLKDGNTSSFLKSSMYATPPQEMGMIAVMDVSYTHTNGYDAVQDVIATYVSVPEVTLRGATPHAYWQFVISNSFPLENRILVQYFSDPFTQLLTSPTQGAGSSVLAQGVRTLWGTCFSKCMNVPYTLQGACFEQLIPFCHVLHATLMQFLASGVPSISPAQAMTQFIGIVESGAFVQALKSRVKLQYQVVETLYYYYDKCSEVENRSKPYCSTYVDPNAPPTPPSNIMILSSDVDEVIPTSTTDSDLDSDLVYFTVETDKGKITLQGTQTMAEQAAAGTFVITDELLRLAERGTKNVSNMHSSLHSTSRYSSTLSASSNSLLHSFAILAADELEADENRYERKTRLADRVVMTWDITNFPLNEMHFKLYMNAVRPSLTPLINSLELYGIRGFLMALIARGDVLGPEQTATARLLLSSKIALLSSSDFGTRDINSQCQDTVQSLDVGETDIDCGGSACGQCALEKSCLLNRDCASNACDKTTLKCVDFELREEEKAAEFIPRNDKIPKPSSASSILSVVAVVITALTTFAVILL